MQQCQLVYTCPYCQTTDFCKYGKDNGIQRYKCKKCRKTFRKTTGTATHQMHKKELIDKYIQTLKKGLSIRKAAQEVGISPKTAFAWRHKLLSSLTVSSCTIENRTKTGKGAQILTLDYSDKGRRKAPEKYTCQSTNLMITDGYKTFIKKLSPASPVKSATEILFNSNKKLCIANSPNRILKAALIKTDTLILKKNTETSIQLKKKAQIITIKLFEWLERFRGVATKYLQHYWDWFAINEEMVLLQSPNEILKELYLTPQSREHYMTITNS